MATTEAKSAADHISDRWQPERRSLLQGIKLANMGRARDVFNQTRRTHFDYRPPFFVQGIAVAIGRSEALHGARFNQSRRRELKSSSIHLHANVRGIFHMLLYCQSKSIFWTA